MVLRSYKKERQEPYLTLVFHDEADFLMRNSKETVSEHENLIKEKRDPNYLPFRYFKNFAGQTQLLVRRVLGETHKTRLKK